MFKIRALFAFAAAGTSKGYQQALINPESSAIDKSSTSGWRHQGCFELERVSTVRCRTRTSVRVEQLSKHVEHAAVLLARSGGKSGLHDALQRAGIADQQ
jgi:hypothetical protein